MHKIRLPMVTGLILGVLLIGGCQQDKSDNKPAATRSHQIVVDCNPLLSLTKHLMGDAVEVTMLTPFGENPADWTPTSEDVVEMQSADLILLNGAGLSPWATTVSLPDAKTVDTSESYTDRLIAMDDVVTHSHGPEGEHSHGVIACTTWLDLDLVRMQAKAVAEHLQRTYPEQRDAIDARLGEFDGRLKSLDEDFLKMKESLSQMTVIGSHPVYQYLQSRYGLRVRALHWEPDVAPEPSEIQKLKDLKQETGATIMLWEAEPMESTRSLVEDIGLKVVVLDPGGARDPANSDWLDHVQEMLLVLRTLAEGA